VAKPTIGPVKVKVEKWEMR
jgi:hypothetical protein